MSQYYITLDKLRYNSLYGLANTYNDAIPFSDKALVPFPEIDDVSTIPVGNSNQMNDSTWRANFKSLFSGYIPSMLVSSVYTTYGTMQTLLGEMFDAINTIVTPAAGNTATFYYTNTQFLTENTVYIRSMEGGSATAGVATPTGTAVSYANALGCMAIEAYTGQCRGYISFPIKSQDKVYAYSIYFNFSNGSVGSSRTGISLSEITNATQKTSLLAAREEYTPPPTDPYADGGYSGDGGGDAGFDLQNDSIDFPNLPTLSAVDTGLVSIYTPSLSQLKSLATFLWNANPTDVDWWKKLVANPLDLILGLSIVPVQVPAGAAQTIKVGLIDTGVSVTKAASQFVTVDCGSITVQKNCGGSALDFSPFTKFSIYLPFIGTRTISTDDIMGRTVHVKYNVDLLSGGCTAMVKITGGPEDNELDAILYQYSGACAISIPLTGETFTNMITSTIQLAASIGATVATGGAAAGVSAASAANSLMSMKPIVERAGGVSGAAGQLGIMQPYLIAEVPRQSVPVDCNKFTGYPSNMKAVIGDLTGYTEVEIIYITGIEATQAELDELETILKGGFII